MRQFAVCRRWTAGVLFALTTLGFVQVSLAQNFHAEISLSENAKRASRLADEVYIKAQDLTLLEEFYVPRDVPREQRAIQDIAAAMNELEKLASELNATAPAGGLSAEIAAFADREAASAREVITVQQTLYTYRAAKEARIREMLLPMRGSSLFVGLQAPEGTPEFYLQRLTWARRGTPKLELGLSSKIAPPLTLEEDQLRKRQQVTDPGEVIIRKGAGSDVGTGAVKRQDSTLQKGLKNLSKSNVLRGEK